MAIPSRSGVLCVGTAVVDVGKVIDSYPALDRLAFIDSISRSTGGPTLNMAVDLRQLGAEFPVDVMCAIGDDEHGAFIRAECARMGIGLDRSETIPGFATSFTDVMVERVGGRRTFFHHPGANDVLLIPGQAIHSSSARILHVGSPGLHTAMDRIDQGRHRWVALLEEGLAQGMHTNLEMVTLAPAEQVRLSGPCLPYASSVVINELEAGALTGNDIDIATPDSLVDWQRLTEMVLGLIELGVRELAVIHTPAGAVAADGQGRTWRQGSVRVPHALVRSTTGAGDAFAAGVLLGLHEGWPVDRCLRLGAAAAAACVMSLQTSSGIAHAQECLRMANGFGFRDTVEGHPGPAS